jgi:prepilin-type processing-associated H-X9-DG protein
LGLSNTACAAWTRLTQVSANGYLVGECGVTVDTNNKRIPSQWAGCNPWANMATANGGSVPPFWHQQVSGNPNPLYDKGHPKQLANFLMGDGRVESWLPERLKASFPDKTTFDETFREHRR